MTRLLTGALLPWRGLVYTADHARLWPWLALPVVAFAALVAPTAWWMWARFPAWVASIAPPPDIDALAGLWGLAVLVLSVVLLVATAAAEWVLVTILARPAYVAVAAWVEDEVAGRAPEADWPTFFADAGWSALHSLAALALYAAGTLLISLTVAIPVAGEIVMPILSALLGAVWLARELVDGPLSRRRLAFAAKLRFVAAHGPELLGLGGITALCMVVPILDLIVLPVAYVGATLWVVERLTPTPRTAPPAPPPP